MHETIEQALISPRYLAGGGDPAWVTVPLHRACGWSYGHDPLMPRVILTSPDQQATLHIDPDPDEPWWTVRHARSGDQPAWSATFDARTPVEIIAALTDALTAPTPPASGPEPYDVLRRAGWHTAGESLASPDRIAALEHVGEDGPWFADARLDQDEGGLIWRAYLSNTTPQHLVAAFAQALADPTPVRRSPGRVPALARDHALTRTVQLPVGDIAFALEQRIAALAARRTDAASNTPVPKPPRVPAPRRTR
ncbi:uncharacterized protein DUF317 [Streptomyces puniciscabiei]|uniref:Uncharacterized protein DUF317 n=1 Tax=Streptomyces puniciscabiei TaxID=164348 RepID=A0A542UIT2_9ACTN|nr:DUF317 domain-containing protein [Streptomyces puniciscabiei]TQK98981.1 uncharacterized protein DUF317 [Streptomyces puniciscabiei]